MLLLRTGLQANNKPKGCVTDLFRDYVMAVNSSWHSYLAQEAKKSYCVLRLGFLHFSSPFFFFMITHFLSPMQCCLCFTTRSAERWLPRDGHASVISATDPSHADPNHASVFAPCCGEETTATSQVGLHPPSVQIPDPFSRCIRFSHQLLCLEYELIPTPVGHWEIFQRGCEKEGLESFF